MQRPPFFSHIHPQPRTFSYQRYAFSRPQRRYEEYSVSNEPKDRTSKTTYYIKKIQKKQEKNENEYENENEFDYDNQGNYFSYVVQRPRRVVTTRSVSQGRNDGRFSFNMGLIRPIRSMLNRVENRRIGRTTRTQRINTEVKPKVTTSSYSITYTTGSLNKIPVIRFKK